MTKNTSSKLEAEIEQNLKKAYDDMASEPLPSRFTDLLDQLKQQEAAGSSKGETGDDRSS